MREIQLNCLRRGDCFTFDEISNLLDSIDKSNLPVGSVIEFSKISKQGEEFDLIVTDNNCEKFRVEAIPIR